MRKITIVALVGALSFTSPAHANGMQDTLLAIMAANAAANLARAFTGQHQPTHYNGRPLYHGHQQQRVIILKRQCDFRRNGVWIGRGDCP